MPDTPIIRSAFIDKTEAIILDNISNEQFGVSELAEVMNMSRSNLLRKIKKLTQLSASQFIRQVRLAKGMELLKVGTWTVSEISHQVGFGSTSYFIKCFREFYGYSPGEVGKEIVIEESVAIEGKASNRSWWLLLAIVSVIVSVSVFFSLQKKSNVTPPIEKSIAVLPFKNESSDSLNLYFVNGLMESALNNLQKIGDLRVISRTSVEKYRNTKKGIPEIAKELQVNYLVEGSGQRIGDQVLLHIQLIEASTDRPIWVEQYNRKVGNVFALQNEVAKKISAAIKAIVTPTELEQIEKKPTDNLTAYDYYLQALDPYFTRTQKNLEIAIPLFEKAIEHDPTFALAYARIAISYYFLDLYQKEKQYTDLINNYSDKALLHDAQSDESLIAKALYYMHISEYRLALPHLEKALEYNPNSSAVLQIISDVYAYYIPDTGKFLEYALRRNQLDIAASDSSAKSYNYLNLSNALIQNGLVDEAVIYINRSLSYDPENYYSPYLRLLILYARDADIEETKSLLIQEWQKDTTRVDLLQEVANFYYYQENYDSAFTYYEKFVGIKEKNGLDVYPHLDIKIGWVYEKMGLHEEAAKFFSTYSDYCQNDQSIYKSTCMAVKYAQEGNQDLAIDQLNLFATQDNYMYWFLVFMKIDPLFKPLDAHPSYDAVIQKIEAQFWKNQATLRKSLEEKGLI